MDIEEEDMVDMKKVKMVIEEVHTEVEDLILSSTQDHSEAEEIEDLMMKFLIENNREDHMNPSSNSRKRLTEYTMRDHQL